MNRLKMTQLCFVALSAGLLFSCKAQRDGRQPTNVEFVAEILEELGRSGLACFDAEGKEKCMSKGERPLAIGDHITPQDKLLLCTRTGGDLVDCKDVRSDPELEIQYVCSNGMCYCTGVANCTLMAADCGPAGGGCGECAVGDCCCLDPEVDMPD